LSIGGLPIRADADLDVNLLRLGFTQAFEKTFFGGTPAFNLNIPILDAELNYTTVTPPIEGANIDDTTSGIGDLGVTGFVGWHIGNQHYNAGMTIYLPTGSYNTASINIPDRSIDVLSNGKNVWAFQPTFAATWLNPTTGLEASGAASFLFSTKNSATNYQTAPAFQFEGAVVQRLKSGWGVGLTGYTYQQLSDDSGSGADLTRAVLGVDSLKARVSGIGPIVVFSGGTLFGADVSLKAKYVKETGARKRLESDIFTLNLSLAF
jgi:hypothetical protein